jgi:capsular exopolysaccharide synthesis family protein
MSRLDEALNRARTTKDDIAPPPIDGPAVDFPVEQETAPEPYGQVVEPLDSVSVSDVDPTDQLQPIESGREERVVEAAGRIEDLPIAEKLMLHTGINGNDRIPVEQYRKLAARLLLAQTEHGIKTVMVTSALPGEGKTLTAANLAITLSQSYRRDVLLMDADLRRPCVHQIFQVPNATGLNDGLKQDSERKVPLLRFSERLTLLTAGRPDSDPMSVLSGSRMLRVLQEAKERFDVVLIDTPPIALITDAHLLSALVDAVVLVVRAGSTPLPSIKAAVNAVGADRVLGVVLNHANLGHVPHAYNYYYGERASL